MGDALPSSHPNAEEFRCSAVRAPLWVAHCLRRGGMPKTCVPRSAHAAVGCVLRLSHPSAAESEYLEGVRGIVIQHIR